MKYFTAKWWASGGEDPPMTIERYEAYLTSIKSELPAKLLEFQQAHTLHDSEVRSIVNNFENKTVIIVLKGWNQTFEDQVCYTLNFAGVTRFNQQLPEQLPDLDYVPSELGDLGYIEIELIQPAVEIRMLFASSAEFQITFTDFTFEHKEI